MTSPPKIPGMKKTVNAHRAIMLNEIRIAGKKHGIEDPVPRFILYVERKRRRNFPKWDWPFTDKAWHGATAEELDYVRMHLPDGGRR